MSKNIKISEFPILVNVDNSTYVASVTGNIGSEVDRKIPIGLFSLSGHTHSEFTGFTESIDNINEELISINSDITGLTETLNDLIITVDNNYNQLTGETSDRIANDNDLYNQITGETKNRIDSDIVLHNEVTGETLNRINADIVLHNEITGLTNQFNYHTGNTDLHLTSSENTLLGGITVDYNSINQLSGITSNVQNQLNNKINTDGTNSDINILSFDTSVSHTPTVTGSFGWNVEDGTMDLKMVDGVTQQIGEEIYFYGKAIENISNRDVVQLAGVQGNHLTFKKAVPAEIQLYPQKILGVATEIILNGNFGYVLMFGKCHDVYTSGWTAGDNIYFDMTSGTTGGITNIEPIAPNVVVRLGSVIKLQTGNSESGIIGIRSSFGISTHNLNDVHMPIITDGQTLIWNNTNKRFEVGIFAITGHTHSQYQLTLESGVNIKTVNNQSILGSGNLNITVTGATPDEVDPIYESEKHLYSLTGHSHNQYLTGYTETNPGVYTTGQTDILLLGKSNTGHTHTEYLPFTTVDDEKATSGFVDGNNITVSYDWTGRTITLNGSDLSYYWRGVKHSLGNGLTWTSTGHTNTVGTWFLYSNDGINFNWSQQIWLFSDIQVANVYYTNSVSTSFGHKETHGLMDYESHYIMHYQIGTFILSGGKLTAGTYAENSFTNTGTTPGFDLAVVKDEDCQTSIPLWSEGLYTTMYVSGETSIFNVSSTYPFTNTGATYINVNNPTTGTLTAGVINRYYNVYQILIPTTIDSASAKYRMVMLQPQATFTTLLAAQAEDVRTLALGSLTKLSPEFVIYSRITYITANQVNVGKCAIATGGVSYVVGSKVSQVNVAGIVGTNHTALSNLNWTNSGHIGTINTIACFDGSGNASEIEQSYYLSVTGATATYATLSQIGDINTILLSIIG